MNRHMMGFSSPIMVPPIGTRRGPVPPVGASSFFDFNYAEGVGDRPTRGELTDYRH